MQYAYIYRYKSLQNKSHLRVQFIYMQYNKAVINQETKS